MPCRERPIFSANGKTSALRPIEAGVDPDEHAPGAGDAMHDAAAVCAPSTVFSRSDARWSRFGRARFERWAFSWLESGHGCC
jgi:hypothetical protein